MTDRSFALPAALARLAAVAAAAAVLSLPVASHAQSGAGGGGPGAGPGGQKPNAQPAAPGGAPRAASMLERGRHEFESNCATCHGIEGRGDGPMRPFLVRPPTDLTRIAVANGGTFPKSRISDLIDGRGMTEPGAHGTRDMPVWGRVYREQSEFQTRGTPFPPEWSVRGRIAALVDYLESIQQR